MPNLTAVLNQIQQERRRLTSQLESLTSAISALNGAGNTRIRRNLSAAARAKIAAAQRARWAKAKGKVVSIGGGRKRTISLAAKARIRAAGEVAKEAKERVMRLEWGWSPTYALPSLARSPSS